MQSVEIRGDPAGILKQLPEAVQKARREVLEDLGRDILAAVRRRTGGRGRVAGVQEVRLGSGGGYAAVSPRTNTFLRGYAAGYVTNSLENGHEQAPGRFVPGLRPGSGRGNGARLRSVRVSGKHMYLETREEDAGALAERAVRAIERALKEAGR